MQPTLENEVLAYVLDFYARHILCGPRGRVLPGLYTRQGGRKLLPESGGFAGPSAAYLALTPRERNPYYGREDLLDFALDAGERLVLNHAEVGRSDPKPSHFTLYPLASLYELAADHAGKNRRARWRETLARNLRAVDGLIQRTWKTLGRPAPFSGTGPNHLFGWLAVGYHQAHVLEDEGMARKIVRAMQRHLRLQAPGGYFPEHRGPAVQYHTVSLGGVADFHRQHPSPGTRRALERGVAFTVRTLYPDLRCIETFDQRNRLSGDPGFFQALPWTPEGRTLLSRLVALHRSHLGTKALQAQHPSWDAWWTLGKAFRCFEHAAGAAAQGLTSRAALPLDRPAFAWNLEGQGLVRKERSWFYTLSAYAHPTLPGNPYHFERTQVLSIQHAAAGLIVGGGNDKRAPHAATIHILEGGEVHYFPPLEGRLATRARPRVLSGAAPCDRAVFEYGAAQAELEVRAESPRRLRVGLAARSNMAEHEVALVLQLQIQPPARLSSGTARLRLAKATASSEPRTFPLGRTLALAKRWQMRLPPGATLTWPHIPWNGYMPPSYRGRPDQAVALLRVPLRAPAWRAEVVIEAGAGG